MTRLFDSDGLSVPVTVVEAGPCWVIQRKTAEKDGYDAVQLGFQERKRGANKPSLGHFRKHGVSPARFVREIRIAPEVEAKPGDTWTVSIFEDGDRVDVAGVSKGKGFQGVMKRHGFGGGRASHGSMFHRAPGSIGASAYPSRVFKNTRMPGRMGGQHVTLKRVLVVGIDSERNVLFLRGAVPGPTGARVILRKATKSGK